MEADQTQGAPATGEGTAEGAADSTVSVAERLYPKQGAEEQAGTEAQKDGEKPTEGKDRLDKRAEETAQPPEHYDLKLPSDVVINAEMRGEFEGLARENGLSNEAVQRFADMHLKSVGEAVREWTAMGEKRFDEVKGWGAEFDRDPYFGGARAKETVTAAKNVLNAFGTPAEVARLKAELNKTGLGSHPVLVRGLARLARLLGDKLPRSNDGKTLAQRMYPNQK